MNSKPIFHLPILVILRPRILIVLLAWWMLVFSQASANTSPSSVYHPSNNNDSSRQNSTTQKDIKQVLILSPYQLDLPVSLICSQVIRAEFHKATDIKTELYFEYLDLNRFTDLDYRSQLLEYFPVKYRQKKIDLIFLCSDEMLDLWLKHQQQFAPNVPTVFFDVTANRIASLQLSSNITGVCANVDYLSSLNWYLNSFPKTNEIVLIRGVGKTDLMLNDPIEIFQKNFRDKCKITDYSTLTLPEIKHRISQLPSTSVVLYHPLFEDVSGNLYRPIDVIREIAFVSSVPVISGYDHFIGTGTIGGYLYSVEQQTLDAVKIGLRVLHGELPKTILIDTDKSNRFIFDYPALQKYHISISDLPPGSIVKHQTRSMWLEYRLEIITILICFVGLLIMVLVLAIITHRLRSARLALRKLNSELEQQVTDRTSLLSKTNLSLQHEIIERNRIEESLREREEKYRFLTENMKDVVWIIDIETLRFTYVSPSVLELRGFTPEEVMSKPMDAALTSEQALAVRKMIHDRLASLSDDNIERPNQFFLEEVTQPCKDGSFVNTEVITRYYRNQKTGRMEILGVSRDITKRKRTEEALRFTQFVIDNMNNSAIWVRPDRSLVYINKAAYTKLGYSKDELLQRSVTDFMPQFDAKAWEDHWKELKQRKHMIFESEQITKSGEVFPVEIRSNYVEFENEEYACGIIADITHRKRTENILRESEEKYRILFRESPDPYLILQNGVYIDCNHAAELILHGDRSQIVGQTPGYFSPEFQPDGRKSTDVLEVWIQEALQTGSKTFEWVHRRLDGTNVYVEVSKISMLLDGQTVLICSWHDITDRKQAQAELEQLVIELQNALCKVQQLEGILPICSYCKKIRDDDDTWHDMEQYVSNRSQAQFSHGMCPECSKLYFPEVFK